MGSYFVQISGADGVTCDNDLPGVQLVQLAPKGQLRQSQLLGPAGRAVEWVIESLRCGGTQRAIARCDCFAKFECIPTSFDWREITGIHKSYSAAYFAL